MGGLVLGRWEGAVRFGRGVEGGVPAPPNTFFMFFRNVNASFVVCSINDFKSDQTNRPNGFPTITLCDQAISKIAMTARGVTGIRPKRTTCEGLADCEGDCRHPPQATQAQNWRSSLICVLFEVSILGKAHIFSLNLRLHLRSLA